jgi:uncharacterized heparinase superfamily protein
MMRGRFRRAKELTVAEVRWRTRELLTTLSDRARFRVHRPEWPTTYDSSVASAVARRLGERRSRCVIEPELLESVRGEVRRRWPAAAAEAAARGDRLLAGLHDLLGYRGLRFPDWHSDPVHDARAPLVCWADVPYLDSSIGDHKIVWELNRHQWWLPLARANWLTGDSRYARGIVDQMESWLDANPPLTGINWASMLEIGFRAISWTMAIHFVAASDERLDSLLPARCFVALERQLTHLERHLSYFFSPNTHLTGEALALYVVGQAFPELASSQRWIDTGRQILLQEIERQVLPDGGHVERSMHYQRYTLDFYLLALLTARRAGDVNAARAFASAATRVADFTQGVADDEGRLPLIGDDDGGMLWPITGRDCADVRDSLAVAAVVLDKPHLAPWGLQEEVFWIAGREALLSVDEARGNRERVEQVAPRSTQSRTFRDTGYVVMRSGDDHAVLDVGAHGYMNGGHAHADALSLTLNIGGRPLLVDPGTATYTMNPQLRDRMRASLSHNTVCIDGRSQSLPAGPFHWMTHVDAHLQASRHNPCFDWAEGTHAGYAPLNHRRSLFHGAATGWLVVDEIRTTNDDRKDNIHRAATHWHVHPAWTLRQQAPRVVQATHVDGEEAWLLFDAGNVSLFHGDDASGMGWYAPVYGTLLPTWSVRVVQDMRSPIAFLSWIGVACASTAPALQRLEIDGDTHGDAVGVCVVDGQLVSTYLLGSRVPASREGAAFRIADYQTDARLLHLRTRDETLVTLDVVDASHALALRDGWLSIAASEPVADLHVHLDGDRLHLSASEPPSQLRLLGRALRRVRAIRLNGRSRPLPPDQTDSLVLSGADWSTAPLVHSGVRFALDEVHPARV